MIKKRSALSLTPYAEKMLKEINFDVIFEKIKNDLVKELEDNKLRTAYDVQEMARFIIRQKRDDCPQIPQTMTNPINDNFQIIKQAS